LVNHVAIAAINTNTNLSAAGLVDGTYKVYTVDVAGNLSAASTNSITISTPVADTTPPTATAITATIQNSGNAVVQSNELGTAYLVKSTLTQLTTSAALTALETANNTLVNHVAIAAINTNTNLSAAGLVDGTYKVYTVDVAGNLSAASTNTVTVASPSIKPVITGLSTATDTGSSQTDGITQNTLPLVSGTAYPNSTVTLYDGGLLINSTTANSGGIWSVIPASALSGGAHTLTTTATVGSLTSAASNSYGITIDTTAPAKGTVISPDNIATAGGTSTTFTIAYSDAGSGIDSSSIGSTDVTVVGASISNGAWNAGTATYTIAAPGGSWDTADNGTYTINIVGSEIKDIAGNSVVAATSVGSFTVNIPAPKSIAYSTTMFVEASANDGSITTSTITLTSDTFTGANGVALGAVTNVPAGLTASLVKTSATTATLSFTGNATAHANINDINNLTVTFADGDFSGGSASAVTNATKNDLMIDFADPAPAPVNYAPRGTVTISGTTQVGQTLTAANTLNDANGLGTISYQWKVGGTAISLKSDSYTLSNADIGKTITVTAAYTDGIGTAESLSSSATAAVTAAPVVVAPVVPVIPPTFIADGVTVQQQITTVNGLPTGHFVVPPVSPTRVDNPTTTHKTAADIPVGTVDKGAGVSLGLPVGVGFQANGVTSPQLINTAVSNLGDDLKAIMGVNSPAFAEGMRFLFKAATGQTFFQQKFVLTSDSNNTTGEPIVIDGSHATTVGSVNPLNTFVVDGSALPAGSTLELKQTAFAAIKGNVTVKADYMANTLQVADNTGTEQTISTAGGGDNVHVGKGLHQVHGGSETDAVQLDGKASDYQIKIEFAKVTITSLTDPRDVKTLVNVEKVQFADQAMPMSYDSHINAVAGTYSQMFGRQGDLNGVNFWADAIVNKGLTLGQMAVEFMHSAEQLQKIGFDIVKADIPAQVEQFYQSFLGRAFDAEGKAFWVDAVSTGRLNLESLATTVIESVEMQSHYAAAPQWDFFL